MGLDIYLYNCKYKFHPRNGYYDMNYKGCGYFRKVNFLVKFVEDTTGKKIDWDVNGEPLFVGGNGFVMELAERCTKVLADHSLAESLLPTCDGFFFGSTQYDEYYFKDVKDVLKTCNKLKNIDDLRLFIEFNY